MQPWPCVALLLFKLSNYYYCAYQSALRLLILWVQAWMLMLLEWKESLKREEQWSLNVEIDLYTNFEWLPKCVGAWFQASENSISTVVRRQSSLSMGTSSRHLLLWMVWWERVKQLRERRGEFLSKNRKNYASVKISITLLKDGWNGDQNMPSDNQLSLFDELF